MTNLLNDLPIKGRFSEEELEKIYRCKTMLFSPEDEKRFKEYEEKYMKGIGGMKVFAKLSKKLNSQGNCFPSTSKVLVKGKETFTADVFITMNIGDILDNFSGASEIDFAHSTARVDIHVSKEDFLSLLKNNEGFIEVTDLTNS